MDDIDDAKSAATQSSEDRNCCHAPQDELEVEVVTDGRAVVSFADSHGQNGVGYQPYDDHVSAYGPVVVFLLLSFADTRTGDFKSVPQIAESFVVAGVDVELLARHLELNRVALAADSST